VKTAVITGGAGGLGRALAASLQAQGWCTILLDIDVTGVETTAQQHPVACDLTDSGQLDAAVAQILDAHPAIDLVIYNAGVTQIGPFDELTEQTHRKVFEINYFSAAALARAMLEPVRRARGTHLAISSVAGFAPLYHRTAYAASKHALEGLFKSLRSEEAPYGVRCQIAAPSFVATNTGRAETRKDGISRPGSATDGIDVMTPEAAAAEILRGVSRGVPMIPVGRIARMGWWLNCVSPRLFQFAMDRKIRKG
jgi:NAD(P)-dependent dehydrogenase (short-subunit alcohol dehydrogenase family)